MGGFPPRGEFGNGAGFGDFSDMFEGLFGRARGRGFGGARRGSDVEAELELSLEEAAQGGHRWVSLSGGRSYETAYKVLHEAMKTVARERGISKRDVYAALEEA